MRCPRPDKIPHYTRAEARTHQQALIGRGVKVGTYKCVCGHWHVGGPLRTSASLKRAAERRAA